MLASAEHAPGSRFCDHGRIEKPLVIFGEHDAKTVAQMRNCMSYGSAVEGVLCADGHLGYAQPVGASLPMRTTSPFPASA
jgi:hypothetical protein